MLVFCLWLRHYKYCALCLYLLLFIFRHKLRVFIWYHTKCVFFCLCFILFVGLAIERHRSHLLPSMCCPSTIALSVSSMIFFRSYTKCLFRMCAPFQMLTHIHKYNKCLSSWLQINRLHSIWLFKLFFSSFCSSSFMGARAIKRRSRFVSRLKCDMRQGERANDQTDQIFCCFMLSQRMKCFVVNDLEFIFNKCTTKSVHWTHQRTLSDWPHHTHTHTPS